MPPHRVAIVSSDGKPLGHAEEEERIASRLLEAGFAAVAWLGLQAPGAAVAHGYGSHERTIEYAAVGIWAVKALGGRDASDLMTIQVTHVTGTDLPNTVSSVSVRGEEGRRGWAVEARRPRRGSWDAVREETDRATDASPKAVLLADVDWAMSYNDAYGHGAGDLMLARVHACIESAAWGVGASFIRVGGEELAVVFDGAFSDATALAESIRREVEALDIAFEHPAVRTHGRVTVSVGLASAGGPDDLRKALEGAVDEAKRAGRNRVAAAELASTSTA